ncbi:MAG: cupin domain-containing protein [Solirubrobacterales bacterium]
MRKTQISDDAAEPANRPDDFAGDVRIQAVNRPDDAAEVEMLVVRFPPGARTTPHTHEIEQTLHVIEGEGVVATETERILVKAGDVVMVPADTWHWHGATPDSAMTHISIKPLGATHWGAPEKNWARYMDV